MRLVKTALLIFLLAASPAAGQLAMPGIGLPRAGDVLGPLDGPIASLQDQLEREAEQLLRQRDRALDRFVRRNRDAVEFDARQAPARKGELLILDASAQDIALLAEAGFHVLQAERLADLGIDLVRVAVPHGMDLPEAEASAARLVPDATIAPDNLYFQSGFGPSDGAGATIPALAASLAGTTATPVGMIDGAPGEAIATSGARGFARGAPLPSDHGSAVAHLLNHAGVRDIRVADVYGNDPAGGNALAIARGLSWLAGNGSRVVTISLVGPGNAVLARAISQAQERGIVIVAAVGNDGPAAPPAFPASYAGVVAVTGVDGRHRPLIEAGRAAHLDYAAPGADLYGQNARGRSVRLRGTSFAAPLVAARIAHALSAGGGWRTRLDREAIDLGEAGADAQFGRGLVCGECRGR